MFLKQIKALHLAVFFGAEEAVNYLLQNFESFDLRDSDGRTPLSWAAEKGHVAVVKLLLATGQVDPNLEDTVYQRTPLT